MRYFVMLAAAAGLHAQVWKLDSPKGLEVLHSQAEAATYKGKPALRLLQVGTPENGGSGLALLPETDFADGTIEVDVAGKPRDGAFEGARGFIGIAFRAQDATRYECFYIRPTNGRADDQAMRNHSTQYMAMPDFPWERLRRENPWVYESYTDMLPGEWTRLRVVVTGVKAKLFVGNNAQPSLIVNDLKHGQSHGKIALWVGQDTDGYFSNLTVKK